MPTTKDTVAVRSGSTTVFARYFCACRKTLRRKHLPPIAERRNMPRMRRPTGRNQSPGGDAKAYAAEFVTYHCSSCNLDYVGRRDRTTPLCNKCQAEKTNASLSKKAEQCDSRAAALSLDARLADEVAMPWERKWTKSMWSRK